MLPATLENSTTGGIVWPWLEAAALGVLLLVAWWRMGRGPRRLRAYRRASRLQGEQKWAETLAELRGLRPWDR